MELQDTLGSSIPNVSNRTFRRALATFGIASGKAALKKGVFNSLSTTVVWPSLPLVYTSLLLVYSLYRTCTRDFQ